MIRLAIVVPCYNEEAVLPETVRRLTERLRSLQERALVSEQSAIYFVDDGSKDRTWALIKSLAAADPRVHGVKLSRNRGHQNALIAGLFTAPGDAVITVDADLQDDLAAIDEMIVAHRAGAQVVFGVRRRRDADHFFKRFSALAYYRVLAMLGVDVVYNHADYRLLSRRVIDALMQFGESNLFLRGIIPLSLVGNRQCERCFDRHGNRTQYVGFDLDARSWTAGIALRLEHRTRVHFGPPRMRGRHRGQQPIPQRNQR